MICHSDQKMRYIIPILLFVFIGCTSDEEPRFSPKPRMYPYVELPTPQYSTVTEKSQCGFVFRKSDQAVVKDRKNFFGQKLSNECWFDLNYPRFDASFHFTYYPLGEEHNYDTLINESFRMVYEHSAIANAIDEQPIWEQGQEKGMAFTLKGPVASPYQFFLTDTAEHFLRGALYFNSKPNPDSIAPVLEYIRTDVDTFINSLQWQ